MWPKCTILLVFLVPVACHGCGKPSGPTANATQGSRDGQATQAASLAAETPEGAVTIFLNAVCAGDDERATRMLTDLAREKTAELDLEVAPPGSDTAQFRLGDIELLDEAAARVACTWSDLDAEGSRTEEQILWVLRRGQEGWRIAGMAPTIFPGEPPLLLDFENPEEMLAKLEWVNEENMRRAQAEAMPGETSDPREAQRQGRPDDEIRR